tara:strand:- start:700 stop:1116 length:417 start_codon:yes stop_codon:yes gene_type:complete
MGLKNILIISFLVFSCNNQINKNIDIGNISILKYPNTKELNKWIKIDSQYAKVFEVRKYFENFVKKDFFEKEEIQTEFGELTWSDLSDYQKKYAELLNNNQKNYKETMELTRFVDSLMMIEYPIIINFVDKIFELEYY